MGNLWVDRHCHDFETWVEACGIRPNRNSLVWVGAGFCAFVLQVFALVDFFMKISFKNRATNNGVDDKTSSYTQTLKKLNENKEIPDDLLELLLAAIRLRCDHTEFIFELIRVLTLSAVVREIPIATSMLLLERSDSILELSAFGAGCRVVYGYGTAFSWFFVIWGRHGLGMERFFDWWISIFSRPLDWFEGIHIGGKQIASFFYDTREGKPMFPPDD
jgi:hypothetical protein